MSKDMLNSSIRVNKDVHRELKEVSLFLNVSMSDAIKVALNSLDKEKELIEKTLKNVRKAML